MGIAELADLVRNKVCCLERQFLPRISKSKSVDCFPSVGQSTHRVHELPCPTPKLRMVGEYERHPTIRIIDNRIDDPRSQKGLRAREIRILKHRLFFARKAVETSYRNSRSDNPSTGVNNCVQGRTATRTAPAPRPFHHFHS